MKSPKISGRQLLIGLALVIVFLLLADFNNRLAELQQLTAQRDTAGAEATDLAQTASALETQIAFATSGVAVEDWAYEEGHLARPGDVVVVPVAQDGPVPTSAPTPAPTHVPVKNWEVWWALFFPEKSTSP